VQRAGEHERLAAQVTLAGGGNVRKDDALLLFKPPSST
jgi:hypothetical protein